MQMGTPLDSPSSANASPAPLPQIPEHTLLRQIGSGSYGEVWLARHSLGAYRAVKIVSRAKFEHERPYERELHGIQKFEPVSRLHEGLVQVLFVGQSQEGGHFYYIMELADGAATGPRIDPENYTPCTLTEAAGHTKRLPIQRCIQLGLQLTSALGFLHKNGLTHRDIKPSNIIFVNGTPKLADIGLVADLGAARSYVGTDGFIPPEGPGTVQADVFSLGKVLYEISTGKDRHDYPALPREFDETMAEREFLELNEVILKACRVDPEDRYQSAEQMHEDLLVLKGGNSLKELRATQRRLKLASRMGAGVTVLAALAIGAYFFARQELGREERLRREITESLVTAEREAANNRQVMRLLASHDTAAMREMLAKTAGHLASSLKEGSEFDLQMWNTLALAFRAIGHFEQTEAMYREALPVARRLHGHDSLQVAEILFELANVFTEEEDPSKYAEGESICRQALAIFRTKLGSQSIGASTALLVLGDLLSRERKLVEAEAAFHEAWQIRRSRLGDDQRFTVGALDALAAITEECGKIPEAERMHREVLNRRRALMRENPDAENSLDVAHSLNHLGKVLRSQGRMAKAEPALREALSLRSKLLGDHPDVASSLGILASVLRDAGRLDEAQVLLRQESAMRAKTQRPEHPDQVRYQKGLAGMSGAEGKLAEAEKRRTELIQRGPRSR